MLPLRKLSTLLWIASDVALSDVRRWLRGQPVTDEEAARLTAAASQLGLTTAELGPHARLCAPSPSPSQESEAT